MGKQAGVRNKRALVPCCKTRLRHVLPVSSGKKLIVVMNFKPFFVNEVL